MMRKMPFIALLCATMPLLSASAYATTITTSYAGGNFNDGIMFDVNVLGGSVQLESIDLNADFGTYDYEVWYREGGIAGQQLNASAWTLLNSFSALQTAGAGVGTRLDITDLLLNAGSTYGLYVTDTGAFATQFTNSLDPSGTLQTSDGALAINAGYGIQYAFADATADRLFNGALNYSSIAAVVPEPESWLLMVCGIGVMGGMLRRRSAMVSKATA